MATLIREEWHTKVQSGKPLFPTSDIPDGVYYPDWVRNSTAKTVQLLKCGSSTKNETHVDKRYKRKPNAEPYPMKRISFAIAYVIDMEPWERRPAYLVEARPLVLVDKESDRTFVLDCQLFRRANLRGEPCDPDIHSKPTIVVSWTGPDNGVYPERDAHGVAQEITMDSCWDCLVDGRKCGKVGLILDGPNAGKYIPVDQRRYRSINEIFGLEERYSLFVKGSRQHVPIKRKSRSSIEPTPEKKSRPNPPPPTHPSLPRKPTPSSSTSAGPPQISASPPPSALPSAFEESRNVDRRESVDSSAAGRSSEVQSGKEVPGIGSTEDKAAPALAQEAVLGNIVEDLPTPAPVLGPRPRARDAVEVIIASPASSAPISRSAGILADASNVPRPTASPVTEKARMVSSINKIISSPANIIIRGAGGPSGGASFAAGSEATGQGLQPTSSASETQLSQSTSTTAIGSPTDTPPGAPPANSPAIAYAATGDSGRKEPPPPGPPSNFVPSTSEKIQWHIRHMAKLCAEREAEAESTFLRAQNLDAENNHLATELAKVMADNEAQAAAARASKEREEMARKAAEAEKVAREQVEAANRTLMQQVDQAKGERDEAVVKGDQAAKEARAKLDRALRERDQAARQRDQAAKERDQSARERDQAVKERDTAARLAKSRLMESLDARESVREESQKRKQAEKALGERRTELIELKAELEDLQSRKS